MNVLVIGHSMVVDANRKFWSVFGKTNAAQVDVVFPREWKSNLIKNLAYKENPDTDAGLIAHPVDVKVMGNGSFYFYSMMALWKILRSKKYDAIIVTQETWAFSSLQVAILKFFSQNRKAKSYLSLCQNIKKKKLVFFWPLEWFITSFYSKMLYCESAICEVLDWKGIRNPTLYFPFTYDEKLFVERTRTPSTSLRIGYLGRLTEEKGLRDLVRAISLLSFPAELILAGNGDMKDELSAMKNVRYLGVIPHNQAHLFYDQIDLLVLPSKTTPFWKEQFGRVIVEAVASGRPVVGSSSGAIPEVLGKIGLQTVFQEGNAEELARRITELSIEMKSAGWSERMEVLRKQNESLFSQKAQAISLGQEIRA